MSRITFTVYEFDVSRGYNETFFVSNELTLGCYTSSRGKRGGCHLVFSLAGHPNNRPKLRLSVRIFLFSTTTEKLTIARREMATIGDVHEMKV